VRPALPQARRLWRQCRAIGGTHAERYLHVNLPGLPYIVSHALDRSGWPWGSNPDKRRSKTIRFSDQEWELVERATARRAIPAAKYVRSAAIVSAEGRTAAVDAENIETIRRVCRGTYISATLKRNELLRDGRGDEIDKRVDAPREP